MLKTSFYIVGLWVCLMAMPAFAQTAAVATPKGPYMIAGGNPSMIWRIDQSTGMISYCIRDTMSNDPGLIAQRPPLCSAWGR